MESRTDNVSSLISLKTHKVVLSPSMKTRNICFKMEIMFSLGKYKVWLKLIHRPTLLLFSVLFHLEFNKIQVSSILILEKESLNRSRSNLMLNLGPCSIVSSSLLLSMPSHRIRRWLTQICLTLEGQNNCILLFKQSTNFVQLITGLSCLIINRMFNNSFRLLKNLMQIFLMNLMSAKLILLMSKFLLIWSDLDKPKYHLSLHSSELLLVRKSSNILESLCLLDNGCTLISLKYYQMLISLSLNPRR